MRTIAAALIASAFVLAGCRSNDDGGSSPCLVSAVTIGNAPATVDQGATVALSATVSQDNCDGLPVVWHSSNDAVLTVDQHGNVTGILPGGPVTITAIAGPKTGTATITVIAVPVAALSILPDSAVVAQGGTFALAVRAVAADSTLITGRTTTWLSGAPGIAAVSPAGLITAGARGSATITATSETKSATAKIFVALPRLTYFWSDDPETTASTPPDSNFSFSTGLGAATVASSQSGTYGVTYANFARSGAETEALFATAFNAPAGGFCSVGPWFNESATVRCVDRFGSPTVSGFSFVAVGSATFPGRFAYAWADNASATTPYAPAAGYRYSSSNQPLTITRTAVGAYTVTFSGQGRLSLADREAPAVTTYGTPGAACQLAGWTMTVAADLSATVLCFNSAGSPTDSPFTIGLFSQPRAGASIALAYADQPTAAQPYVPANSAVLPLGVATVSRDATGAYEVRFDGLVRTDVLKETFLVTAVGTTSVRCQIGTGGWGFDATGATVTILCANPFGTPVDSRFVIVGLQ